MITRFLLVEDDPDHAVLIQAAFKSTRPRCELSRVASAEGALEQLSRALDGREQLPHVLLVDVNLPGMSGLEMLERVKQSPAFQTLPVVMLTTSASQQDLEKAYSNRANSYVLKPTDFNELREVMQSIVSYWADVNVRRI
jgi:CheY-like chemotaxis protein